MSVNENFIYVVIEGLLAMVCRGGGVDSVDLESRWSVVANYGADILPSAQEVRKTTRAITRDGWRL
jgi:hypothetical protein